MKNLRWKLSARVAAVSFLLVLTAATLPAADSQSNYLAPDELPATVLLAPPPLPDSAEQAADLAAVETVSHAAPSNEVAAALSERKFTVFNFTPAVGDFFQAAKLPKTEAFFYRVQKDAESVTDGAKNFYKRPRPYVIDPSLAAGKLETSFSYPSGHSTETMTLALVLAEIFPDKQAAIIAHARLMGWHRVEIARHYPTDIYAGRVLAQAIVRELNKSADFQKDLAEAKAEVIAAQ